jgi:hypothetical protein
MAGRDMNDTLKWSETIGLPARDADRFALGGNRDILAAEAGQTKGDNETSVGHSGLKSVAHYVWLQVQDINQILAACR